MIQVENLSFNYVGTKREVFSDFSLQLTDNKIYGLLGKNGTGKSTLLYLLCGLLRPKKGGVFIDGVLASDRRSAMLEDIFMVPEEFTLPQVTLDTYVKMNKGFYPHFSEEVLERCLADFELSRQTKLHQLSMGQKKKAFMSFALATGTRLLLMDEPTNGLDIPSKAQFRSALMKYTAEDSTIVISTHQVRDLENIIDPIIILDRQDVLLNASLDEISEKLYFDYGNTLHPESLYSEQLPGGFIQVYANAEGIESKVNIEALFNAVHRNKALIKAMFQAR